MQIINMYEKYFSKCSLLKSCCFHHVVGTWLCGFGIMEVFALIPAVALAV